MNPTTMPPSLADLHAARKLRSIRQKYPELLKAAQVHDIAITHYGLPKRTARKLTEGRDRVLSPHEPALCAHAFYPIHQLLIVLAGQQLVDLSYTDTLDQ